MCKLHMESDEVLLVMCADKCNAAAPAAEAARRGRLSDSAVSLLPPRLSGLDGVHAA